MFRNNRIARIIAPLVIIAILVVVMEFVDNSKKETKTIVGKCSVEVECKTILKNMDKLNKELRDSVPKDGILLKKTNVDLYKGDTAYTVLYRTLKRKNISLEVEDSLGSKYIKGIDNFEEKCCGPKSGWNYIVNNKKPGVGSSSYKLKNKDVMRWSFTCNLGKDN